MTTTYITYVTSAGLVWRPLTTTITFFAPSGSVYFQERMFYAALPSYFRPYGSALPYTELVYAEMDPFDLDWAIRGAKATFREVSQPILSDIQDLLKLMEAPK